jgi:LacI family transcriptional regulator
MNDVARRAGVHAATVSRALRNDPRITPEQQARIRRVVAELGYRTNPLVAALMSARRTGRAPAFQSTLGYITKYAPGQAVAFARNYSELMVGARDRALAQGYQIEEINLHDPAFTPRRVTEILHSRGIHGLLIAPLHSVHESVDLDWTEFGAVAMGYSLSHVAVNRVSHNHFTAFGLAARSCREAGARRLGLVLQKRVHEKVRKGWVAGALLDQSEQPVADRVPPLLLDELSEQKFCAWFRRHRPEVVLGVNVTTILGWLKKLGRAVPRDTGFVSLDRRPVDRGIAGISQDYANLGRCAADLLVSLLHRNERGLPLAPLTLLVDGVWIPDRTFRTRFAPE